MSFSKGPWNTNIIQNYVLTNLASPIIDLGRQYDYIMVQIPVINTGPIKLEATYSLDANEFRQIGTANATEATAGNYHACWAINGHQFIKIMQYHVQNANITWHVRGMSI